MSQYASAIASGCNNPSVPRCSFSLGTRDRRRSPSIPPPATMLDQGGNGRLRQLESAKRMLAPVSREALFAYLQKRCGLVAARVVHRDRKRRERLGLGDEVPGVLSARCIANDISHCRPRILQFAGGGLELLPISPRNRHRMSASCEAARDGSAQAARCAHAHNEYARPRRFSQFSVHHYLHSDAFNATHSLTCLPRSANFTHLCKQRCLRNRSLSNRQIDDPSGRRQSHICVPHPLIITESNQRETAEISAKKTADLV